MRISNIKIENFGIYKDLCEFCFDYNPDKKVTLLKGENGSGKTTLLNSIKTALYGPMLYGSKKNNNGKYMEFIDQMLNTDARKNSDSEFGIEIDITTNLPTFNGAYKITRIWEEQNNKIKEIVSIKKNTEKLDEHEVQNFFNMFYKMYPLELFELYYLDGEKIDQLSFFDGDIYALIESSMNIDLFKVLQNDLETYAIKKHKSDTLNNLKHEKDYNLGRIEDFEKKIIEFSIRLQEYEIEDIAQEVNMQKLKKEIEESNQNLPVQIKASNDELKDLKKLLQSQIIEIIPLLLLEEMVEKMTSQLEIEQENTKAKILEELLHDDLKATILKKLDQNIKKKDLDSIFAILKAQYTSGIEMIHSLNNDEYQNLMVLLGKVNGGKKDEAIFMFERYHELQKKIRKLNEEMNDFDETFVTNLIQELLNINIESQKIKNMIADTSDKIEKYSIEIDNLKNKNVEIETEIWKGMKSENVTQVVKSIKTVIVRYIEAIRVKKIQGIEDFTKEMFENLLRKKNFVKKVRIRENEIYIETQENNKLNVANLSSGERQLFVLSIIYALFKVSERSTPLIFDTLLGRLDKNHQQEVMEKFIANCPDQVIILATDSELENIKKETLNELVNTRYSIDFSKNINRIEVII